VTYYNFTSDQFTGFHGIVIPGTLRDSLFILAGLLGQQTFLALRRGENDYYTIFVRQEAVRQRFGVDLMTDEAICRLPAR